jgi:hypothetical protein
MGRKEERVDISRVGQESTPYSMTTSTGGKAPALKGCLRLPTLPPEDSVAINGGWERWTWGRACVPESRVWPVVQMVSLWWLGGPDRAELNRAVHRAGRAA